MFIQTEWLVVFFFILLGIVFIITYALNSKRKWIEKATELGKEKNRLRIKLSSTSDLRFIIKEILFNIKDDLSEKQYEVFILILKGYSSKEIGEKLYVASTTVDGQIREIAYKLKVHTRPQIAAIFIEKLKANAGISDFLELK